MNIKDNFILNKIGLREFYSMEELHRLMLRDVRVMSWGVDGWQNMANHALKFRVKGHHFKGHVIIVVNALDYFDIYLVKGPLMVIKDIIRDIDISSLIDTIDRRVERIPEYNR